VAATPHPAALVDSDVLIDGARGHPEARAFLNDQNQAFRVQIIIVGCRNKIELSQTKRFLEPVRILLVNESISDTAYDLIQTFTLSHGLMIPDALIAATALESGLTLLTKNTRHFQMIPKLEVVRPY
jgi:predicted nucleic acid-binding protein